MIGMLYGLAGNFHMEYLLYVGCHSLYDARSLSFLYVDYVEIVEKLLLSVTGNRVGEICQLHF